MKPILVIKLDDLIGIGLVVLAGLAIGGAALYFKIAERVERRRRKP